MNAGVPTLFTPHSGSGRERKQGTLVVGLFFCAFRGTRLPEHLYRTPPVRSLEYPLVGISQRLSKW